MGISPATRALLDRYQSGTGAVPWRWESTVVDVVLRYGSRADAEALLPAFLDDPEAREALVPVFARRGGPGTAEQLLDVCVENGRLRDGVPTGVLHAVGYLGCETAERVLWAHVGGESYDHYVSKDACLGLLHLPCRGLRDEISGALERHAGAHLFPEFLPVLATKTGDPAWLGRLVEWGEGDASTDCNGGLILGIALHGGNAARVEFTRLLWNPYWEAYGGGTGSDHWAYAGARVLGLGMPDLYAGLVERLDSGVGSSVERHCLAAFSALLGHWTEKPWLGLRMAPDPEESSDALSGLLFDWSTPHQDDSLIGLAGRALGHDDILVTRLRHTEAILRNETRHELELQVITDLLT
ncbi:hypothetical protein [Streptomyces sp. NPDC047000]|uniref:hypothetical protein n=1 Tax=Streptomyces sp. NPDC047000 TaxID=3155474 RepID=UPI00340E8B87